MQFRWKSVTAALLIGAATFAGANAVDRGLTRPWPGWARAAWAGGLILGVLAALFLLLTGLGVLTDEALSETGDPSSLHRGKTTVGVFITVYVATLVTAVALALGLESLYDIQGEGTILVFCGAMFLLASTGKPWWLYETIRRVRWFAFIERDAVMRAVLAVIGAFCIAGGVLGKVT